MLRRNKQRCVRGLVGPAVSPARQEKQSRALQIHNGDTVSQDRAGRGNKQNTRVSQTTCHEAFSRTGLTATTSSHPAPRWSRGHRSSTLKEEYDGGSGGEKPGGNVCMPSLRTVAQSWHVWSTVWSHSYINRMSYKQKKGNIHFYCNSVYLKNVAHVLQGHV